MFLAEYVPSAGRNKCGGGTLGSGPQMPERQGASRRCTAKTGG